MDLRQLEMFRSVAKEGTFSRAAERLRVSRSAVSRQVKLLEEELGGRLLHHVHVENGDGEAKLWLQPVALVYGRASARAGADLPASRVD